MTSRVFTVPLQNVVIPIETDQSIPYHTQLTEDEIEKKATQTIYAKLKQVACSPNPKERWEDVEKILNSRKYKGAKKKIVQKLDDDNNYAPIHYAIISNNRYICSELLGHKYECNVNLLGWDGQTPLHFAACSSKIEEEMKSESKRKDSILTMLLNHEKIRVNIQDDKGRTPLHHAIMRNHTNIVKKLCQCEAINLKALDIQGATPIHYAYRFGAKDNIDPIFSLRADYFGIKTIDDKTPFDIAAEYGHVKALQEYFKRPPSPKHSNRSIRTFIDLAIRHRDLTLLPKHIFTQDERHGNYILQLACRHPNGHELLKNKNVFEKFPLTLLSKQISADGFTPLMIAVKYQSVECVRYLLDMIQPRDHQILTTASFDLERTVFHICAEFANETITDLLLAKAKLCKIDLTMIDVMGNTPLHICTENENQDMCNKLLEIVESLRQSGSTERSGSDRRTTTSPELPKMLTIRNNNGLTPFHLATENGYDDIVVRMTEAVSNPKLLIENCDEQLRTSLHIAALKGNVTIVELFIELEADVNIRDVNDHTPLHEASRWSDFNEDDNQHRIDCIDCLVEARADVNALNIHRETPLHIACRYSSSDLVKKLLDHRVDFLQTNFRGYNCFEVAIEEKNEEVVKYIINQEIIFELMRNAQIDERHLEPCCTCGDETCRDCCCMPCCGCLEYCSFFTCRLGLDRRTVDTPMRKPIIQMPDMAYEVLEKCTTTIGNEKSKVHQQFFDYEFLEDQYVIDRWAKDK